MGPDEFATREELGLILKLIFAKFRQQTEMIVELCSLLQDKGLLTNEEILSFGDRLKASECSKAAKEAYEKLRVFLAMHNIVQQYEDPPEE